MVVKDEGVVAEEGNMGEAGETGAAARSPEPQGAHTKASERCWLKLKVDDECCWRETNPEHTRDNLQMEQDQENGC